VPLHRAAVGGGRENYAGDGESVDNKQLYRDATQ